MQGPELRVERIYFSKRIKYIKAQVLHGMPEYAFTYKIQADAFQLKCTYHPRIQLALPLDLCLHIAAYLTVTAAFNVTLTWGYPFHPMKWNAMDNLPLTKEICDRHNCELQTDWSSAISPEKDCLYVITYFKDLTQLL